MASRRTADSRSRSGTVVRIEAFSDAVTAIIITIMVLELKVPVLEGTIQSDFDFSFLYSLAPKFLAYVISFAFIATAWFAHVALMRGLNRSSILLLWWNTLFLFFLSLLPWATAFVGNHPFLPQAVALWGLAVTMVCFTGGIPLTWHVHKLDHLVPPAWARRRNIISIALFASSVPLAFMSIYVAWFVIITTAALGGLPFKIQMKIFSSKSDRLARS
jgi:TMEM175 potassium channel family protein